MHPRWLLSVVLVASVVGQSGWQQLQPLHAPSARGQAHAAYDIVRAVTVLFGGSGNSGSLSDTWEWNGADWTARATANTPPGRHGAAFGYDPVRGRMVLFGGYGTGDLSDTWEYDGTNWSQRVTPGPSLRRFSAMAFDPGSARMILFGGLFALPITIYDQTWAWNGAQWQLLTPAHAPVGRWSQGMVTDYGSGKILLHGGTRDFTSQQALGDTWTWDGTDWERQLPAPLPGTFELFGFTFDGDAGVPVMFGGYPGTSNTRILAADAWRAHATASAPSPRWGPAMAFDVARGESVLFGGHNPFAAVLAETWVYRTAAIGRWTAVGVGCAGSAGTPILRRFGTNLPRIGAVTVFDVTSLVDGMAALVTGFSTQTWSGVPLPGAMDAAGMFGCTAYTDVVHMTMGSAVGGRALFFLTAPNHPALIGVSFATQAVSWDPGANPLGVVVSNAGIGVIGEL